MTTSPSAAPGVAVDATIAELMTLIDEHGQHRWDTAWNERADHSKDAERNDKAAVKARAKIETALRTALLAGAAGGQTETVLQVKQSFGASLWANVSQAEYDDCTTEKRKLYAHPPAPVGAPQDLTDAAEQHAAFYEEDNRPHIKTDIINAFYAGSKFLAATQPSAAPAGPKQDESSLYRALDLIVNCDAFAEPFAKKRNADDEELRQQRIDDVLESGRRALEAYADPVSGEVQVDAARRLTTNEVMEAVRSYDSVRHIHDSDPILEKFCEVNGIKLAKTAAIAAQSGVSGGA